MSPPLAVIASVCAPSTEAERDVVGALLPRG
jgi:hypothetical protein